MDLYTLFEGREIIKLTEQDNKICIYRLLSITILPGKNIEFNWDSGPVGMVPIERYNDLTNDELYSLSPYRYMDTVIDNIEMKKKRHRNISITGILCKGDCL